MIREGNAVDGLKRLSMWNTSEGGVGLYILVSL